MEYLNRTRQAGADMNTDAFQYHAIALDDGLVAANGGEAGGILQNKPKSGEACELGISGAMRYRAGGAVAAGKALTVSASGWLTAAASGSYIVGRNSQDAVTSGSIGEGFFDFANPIYAFSSSYAW